MNILTQIPAWLRQVLYSGYVLAVITLGGIQAAYAAMDDHPTPAWLKGAYAAMTFVSGFLGLTAASNVRVNREDHGPDYDPDAVDTSIEDSHGPADPIPED